MSSYLRREARRHTTAAKKKLAAIKWREWLLLPTIPATAAALLINTIVIITYLQNFAGHHRSDNSNDNNNEGESGQQQQSSFSFYDLPPGPTRTKVLAAISLEAVLLVALWAETLYFLLFFHRDDGVRRRGAVQTVLSLVLVVFSVVVKVLSDRLQAMPFASLEATGMKRPDLTLAQYNAAYGSWLDDVVSNAIFIVLIVNVVDAVAHLVVVVFWLWLLPARQRLPDRYEPVVVGESRKKGWRIGMGMGRGRGRGGDGSSYRLVDTAADAVNAGPLEIVFQEHERARLLSRRTDPSDALQVSSQGPSSASASSDGPRFDPIVRYWMVNPLRGGAWPITAVFLVFFFVDPIFEIVFYTLTKKYELRCRWYCYLAFAYPWPIVLWIATVVILLRMKIPFNRRVFGSGPRLDVLITITALPFIPLWLLVHITRFAEFSIDGGKDYQDYIESEPGRSGAYGAIVGLKVLEVTFAIILGLCVSIMGHTVYKFYSAGKGSDETET